MPSQSSSSVFGGVTVGSGVPSSSSLPPDCEGKYRRRKAYDVDIVQSKLAEFFWEWLSLPETQKFVDNLKHQDFSEDVIVDDAPEKKLIFGSTKPPDIVHAQPQGHTNMGRSPTSDNKESPPASPQKVRRFSPNKESYNEVFLAPDRPNISEPPSFDGAASLRASRIRPNDMCANNWKKGGPIGKFFSPRKTEPTPLTEDQHGELKILWDSLEGLEIENGDKVITKPAELEPLVVKFLKMSRYFCTPIWHRITSNRCSITFKDFKSWCDETVDVLDQDLTFFHIARQPGQDHLCKLCFRELLETVLEEHPGLDFLKGTREFQEKYADTVIARIFFGHSSKDNGKITLSDLRRNSDGSIVETWTELDKTDDMKVIRRFFSYEHFYVIYCTFWELDSDHDCLLDKDDLLRYDTHALSRRAADRIFAEIPRKFSSGHANKMCYDDFIYFLLCEQDRTCEKSISYWFSVMDIDGDGYLRPWEMRHFFEEQSQRLNFLNYEQVHIEDIACQVYDMIRPRTRELLFQATGLASDVNRLLEAIEEDERTDNLFHSKVHVSLVHNARTKKGAELLMDYFIRYMRRRKSGQVKSGIVAEFNAQTRLLDSIKKDPMSQKEFLCSDDPDAQAVLLEYLPLGVHYRDLEHAYSLGDFFRNKKQASNCFSVFISLNKFLSWEHRDPFAMHQICTEAPTMTDWDRWCQGEYQRLACDEEQQNQDVGDPQDGDPGADPLAETREPTDTPVVDSVCGATSGADDDHFD